MSITLRYEKITGSYYSDICGNEYDCDEFDYEVSDSEVAKAIAEFLYEDYFGKDNFNEEAEKKIKERLLGIIEDNFILNELAEAYEDALKDYFSDEAFEWYGA
jgi:hypothetical protein